AVGTTPKISRTLHFVCDTHSIHQVGLSTFDPVVENQSNLELWWTTPQVTMEREMETLGLFL
ncbi:hypothetical protein PJP14_29395, partial [Mycobacterium kansasii]